MTGNGVSVLVTIATQPVASAPAGASADVKEDLPF